MIKEVIVENALTYENPPDGGHLPIIDPYTGCTIGCPYCFRLKDEGWNENILVNTNMPEMIRKDLKNWSKDKTIYIGSRCDPYMKLEKKYELTRKCIIELDKLQIPIIITTKSNLDLLMRDIDLIKNYSSDVTISLGMSNLRELIKAKNSHQIKNIKMANELHKEGIKVWAFITPILPGITDVDQMISSLDKNIPIYLDKLRIEEGTKSAKKMLKYINEHYPELNKKYEEILYNDKSDYIEKIRDKWIDNCKVNFVFD